MKQGVAGLNNAKIKAQVKPEELNRKDKPMQAKQAEIDATLKKYRNFLAKNETAHTGANTTSLCAEQSHLGELYWNTRRRPFPQSCNLKMATGQQPDAKPHH
jgi:hypothetical protein